MLTECNPQGLQNAVPILSVVWFFFSPGAQRVELQFTSSLAMLMMMNLFCTDFSAAISQMDVLMLSQILLLPESMLLGFWAWNMDQVPLRSGVLDLDYNVEDTGRQVVDVKVKMELHVWVLWVQGFFSPHYLHDLPPIIMSLSSR